MDPNYSCEKCGKLFPMVSVKTTWLFQLYCMTLLFKECGLLKHQEADLCVEQQTGKEKARAKGKFCRHVFQPFTALDAASKE